MTEPENVTVRTERGPLENAIADAVKHTPAVVVISVGQMLVRPEGPVQ